MDPVSPEPSIGEALRAAMNAARKAQDKDRTLVLGTILANLKNREIELRRPATDDDVVDVLRKGIKTRRESVEQYTAANRTDLAENERAQIKVLEEFLPPAVDPEEIRAAVRAAIAGGAKDIGKVMGQVMPQVQGPGRRQGDQPDRARGAAGRLMSASPLVSPHGVPAHAQGGTPSPLPPDQSADALETIEFGQVLELVAGRAVGPLGAARVRGRRPTDDLAWIRGELARVGEVAGLFRRGDALLAEPIPDVGRALAGSGSRAACSRAWSSPALQRVLVAARLVQADLRRVADDGAARRRARAAAAGQGARAAARAVAWTPTATLLDTASPRLAAARREVHAARQRLLRKLESLLRGLDATSAPVDASVTVRGGRYVIPVRRDSRSRPGGIVHDECGSAGTLFIEPAEAIELGNALREAEVEEEREVLRVLRELTDLLRPELPDAPRRWSRCASRWTISWPGRATRWRCEGEVPEVAPAPADARGRERPASAAARGRREPVVPFDLELPGRRAHAAHQRSQHRRQDRAAQGGGPRGRAGAERDRAAGRARAAGCPVFRRFFADIGDRQCIAASLSTFSAHVRHAAPDPRRGRRRDARPARRDRQRHRSGRRRGARRRGARVR